MKRTMDCLPEYVIGRMLQLLPKYHAGYSIDYIHYYKMMHMGKLNEYHRYVQLCSIPKKQFTPQDHAIYELGKNTRPLWTHLYNNDFITRCIVTLQKHLKHSYITYVILHDVLENEVKHVEMNEDKMAMLEMLKFMIGKPRI